MKLNRKVIIFGAGKNGKKLFFHLGEENIICFCDNYKSGTRFCGKKVVDFLELKNMAQNLKYDVILSIDVNEARKQLLNNRIPYWEYVKEENNFFNQEVIQNTLDAELYNQYIKLNCYKEVSGRTENWYRTSYVSNTNKQLVTAMKNNDKEMISQMLSHTYDKNKSNVLYSDEYYENRPGMRLIAKLIKREQRETITVCDLACGHGDFLKKLQSETITCYGTDTSFNRCQALNTVGIECKCSMLEHSEYQNSCFDFVTLMECLEHVSNPFDAMEEAYRILKKNGQIFVTVPYGNYCDSPMHVRQFYENDLYSVAKKCGFIDIRIMKLPYMNYTYNDNLLMSAIKK